MADTGTQDPSPKPCPFCGSTMIFERIAWAKCLSCEACGPVRTPEGSAIQMWNMRKGKQWRPIETALKGGIALLLRVEGPCGYEWPEIGYWGKPAGFDQEEWVECRHKESLERDGKKVTKWRFIPEDDE